LTSKIKIGALVSSGGSTLTCAYEIFNKAYPNTLELYVVTDRKCGIEEYCVHNGIVHRRFEEKDRTLLSKEMADYFDETGGVDFVVLYFLKMVTKELFDKFITLNVHPSLLPSFAGLNPVKQAVEARAGRIGVTLHMVNEMLDSGEIIVRTSSVMPSGISLADAESLSFCQKTYVTLWLFMALKKKYLSLKMSGNKGISVELNTPDLSDNKNIRGLDEVLLAPYKKKMQELGYGDFLKLIVNEKL